MHGIQALGPHINRFLFKNPSAISVGHYYIIQLLVAFCSLWGATIWLCQVAIEIMQNLTIFYRLFFVRSVALQQVGVSLALSSAPLPLCNVVVVLPNFGSHVAINFIAIQSDVFDESEDRTTHALLHLSLNR